MSALTSNKERIRGQVTFYIIGFLFIILIFNLFKVQVVDGKNYKKIAYQQHLCSIPLPGLRGRILDRNGEMLALSLNPYSVGVNPNLIKNKEETARTLSQLLSVQQEEILKKLKYNDTQFIWLARKINDEVADKIRSMKMEGLYLQKEETGKRFYPNYRLGSHILGYTGIDDQGLDGIEGIYENYLSGKPGCLRVESDNYGRAIPNGERELQPATDGDNVILTIDKFIQYIAETELRKAVEKHKARGGSIVVMDPMTGEILALANYPDFDINQIDNASKSSLRNRGISDAYEPGSTFKVIMAASALDSGKITMDDMFPCGNSIQVGGWTICNAADGLGSEFGYEKVKDIIKYSFNTGSAAIGMKMGKDVYYKYIQNFGFGKVTGVELPGEAEGIVLAPQDWSISSLATISFGQGISVTPIQMVRAVSSIANGGKLFKPMIVKEIRNSQGQVIKTFSPQVERQVLKPQTCKEMIEILEGVVADGTGKKAQIPGYTVAGKTGTAQLVENGIYAPNKFIPSFIGFAPSRNPRVLILVKIDVPQGIYWGGYVAAPVFREVASEALMYMGIPAEKNATLSVENKTE